MPICFYPKAATRVRLPLACDPAVQAVNTAEAIAAYLKTGDPAGLEVPAAADHVVFRILTHEELTAARLEVGIPPVLGVRLKEDGKDPDTAVERKAAAEYRAWLARAASVHLVAWIDEIEGWNGGDGAPLRGAELADALNSVRPVQTRTALLLELQNHVSRLGEVEPGKA